MTNRSHRRALPALLVAALTLGGIVPATAAAAPADSTATAKAAQAKRRAARRKSTRRAVSQRGSAFLSGKGTPTRKLGRAGDFYLRTSDRTLYGPKTSRGWGAPTSLVGPQGAQGPQGAPGTAGPQGTAGTPAFGSGVVTNLASTTLTGTYGAGGYVVSPTVDVGTVQLPAGVSLAQLRLRIAPGAGFDARSEVSCFVANPTTFVVNGFATAAAPATDQVGWSSLLQPTAATVTCGLNGDGGTEGTTVSATLAGSQVVVFPTNVPAA